MLRLRKLSHCMGVDSGHPWSFDWDEIGDLTMMVGVNATGKSRILNVINGLARVITQGQQNLADERFDASFVEETTEYNYELTIKNGLVQHESLTVNGEPRIIRTASESKIYTLPSADLKSAEWIGFGIAPNELAIRVKRDYIQHPYIEPIFEWSENCEHVSFNSEGSRFNPILPVGAAIDYKALKDSQQVVPLSLLLIEGNKHQPKFSGFVIDGMRKVGFPITSLEITTTPPNIGAPMGMLIGVKEPEREAVLPQTEMSSGMIRTLAVLMKLSLAELGRTGTLLIDDVGEGLDYARSVALINFLISEAKRTGIQLFMTTNDRFVMNEVPLEYWIILQRTGGKIDILDRRTQGEIFKKYTRLGLTNFDLFRSLTKN